MKNANPVHTIIEAFSKEFARGGVAAFCEHLLAYHKATVTHTSVPGTKEVVPEWELRTENPDRCSGHIVVYTVNERTQRWKKVKTTFTILNQKTLEWGDYSLPNRVVVLGRQLELRKGDGK